MDNIELLEGETYTFSFGYFRGEQIFWTYDVDQIVGTARFGDYSLTSLEGSQVGGFITISVSAFDDFRVEDDTTFILTIQGTARGLTGGGSEITYSYEAEVKIVDNDKVHCTFDIDADGTAEDFELNYSEFWKLNSDLIMKQHRWETYISEMESQVSLLQKERVELGEEAKSNLIDYLIGVGTLGVKNVAVSIATSVKSIVQNTYKVLNDEQSVEDGFKEIWMDAIQVANDLAKDGFKSIPLLGLIKDTEDVLNNGQETLLQLNLVVGELNRLKTEIHDANIRRDQIADNIETLYECLGETNSKYPDERIHTEDIATRNEYRSSSKNILEFDLLASDDNEITNIAKGTKKIDIGTINSTNLDALYIAYTSDGNDKIKISQGNIIIDMGDGKDSLLFKKDEMNYYTTDDILFLDEAGQETGVFVVAVGDSLLVSMVNVERLVFGDGVYTLSGSNFEFVSNDGLL